MLKKALLHPTKDIRVQFIRYGMVVVVAFPVDFGLLYVFTDKFHIYYLLSAVLSFTISMIVNYVLSVIWVFNERTARAMWVEAAMFFFVGFVGLAITAFLIWMLTSVFGLNYLVSKLIAVCIVFFWSFGARRFFFQTHLREYLAKYRALAK